MLSDRDSLSLVERMAIASWRRDPDFDPSRWEDTAGRGIVPKGVSVLGRVGTGSGVGLAVVVLLLLTGVIDPMDR